MISFNKTCLHFWALFHSYFLNFANVLKWFSFFVVRIWFSGYPANETEYPENKPFTGYKTEPDIPYIPIRILNIRLIQIENLPLND